MGAFLGYLASALMLGTFGMRTMMPLRIIALGSNLLFIAYGVFEQFYIVILLNTVILPLNIWRLVEIMRLIKNVKNAVNQDDVFEALIPFGRRITLKSGETIIRKGDLSEALYLVVEGKLYVEEAKAELGPGAIVGEIGVLSGKQRRTASVSAKTDCVLARVSAEDFQRVYFTNPAVGLSLVRLVIDRLIEQLETRRLPEPAATA
ncbi:MAG TPA: cyclic nucleotide-binding domain-containing protein [Stellaceae bacterium]|nr:cyclic nucleotide-binding domain-containing protein [Stellaceae bacterium]